MIPALGATAAAELHEVLTRRTVAVCRDAVVAALELWCSPGTGFPLFQALRRETPLRLRVQHGRDLGERMDRALGDGLKRASAVVLVGTDCADLTVADLGDAFRSLRDGADVVLGPAADGGYVLVGVGRPVPEIFSDMPWGSGEVMAVTRRRLAEHGRRWIELPVRHDVDGPQDLWRVEELWSGEKGSAPVWKA